MRSFGRTSFIGIVERKGEISSGFIPGFGTVPVSVDVNPFFRPRFDTISDEERGNGCPSRS
jgi:hypothetical protein